MRDDPAAIAGTTMEGSSCSNKPVVAPFVADLIISNPVTYVHVHCAEALGE